jgi:hypothetical protein
LILIAFCADFILYRGGKGEKLKLQGKRIVYSQLDQGRLTYYKRATNNASGIVLTYLVFFAVVLQFCVEVLRCGAGLQSPNLQRRRKERKERLAGEDMSRFGNDICSLRSTRLPCAETTSP